MTFKTDQAKRKILKLFSNVDDTFTVMNDLSDEFFIETLDAIKTQIPFKNMKFKIPVLRFLFSGCSHFSRWFNPIPYIVTDKYMESFNEFLRYLIKLNNGNPDSTAAYQVERLKTRVYRLFDECAFENYPMSQLTIIENDLKSILPPINRAYFLEFQKFKIELVNIIDSLKIGKLKTVLETKLPYLITLSPLEINLFWKKIPVKITIHPSFMESDETFLKGKPIVSPVGASRWQTGVSNIKITINALIDVDVYSDALQNINNHRTPINGWPKCFTFAFHILNELCWFLRMRKNTISKWIPAPRDLADIKSCLITKDGEEIDFRLKGSPANIIQVMIPSEKIAIVNLGEFEELKWSQKCRSTADMYLELGETNEALFWLNVAVESFFNERFLEISKQVDDRELLEELGSPKAFWEPAEEIVSLQYPEMKGKIHWPTTNIHVSMYAKLKYLYKKITMKGNVKDLLKHYKNVSKHRNALFHGANDQRISVEELEKALKSFDWIVDNMLVEKL